MQQYVNDMYAPLAHIPEMTNGNRPNWIATWVDAHDARRLTAYTVLGAYRNNTRRFHLPDSLWVKPTGPHTGVELGNASAENYREYGDTALLIDTARSLLLGSDQIPTLADDAAEAFATWLDEWATKERLTQKLLEGEEHTIGDGDGVYALGWSTSKNRPVLRVIDPGFYFPAPSPGGDVEEFPDTVHIAWEWQDAETTWIRRQTWTLVPLEQPTASRYGQPRTFTCLYRSVDYDRHHLLNDIDVYSPEMARQNHRRIVSTEGDADGWVDLLVDFVPVVHVPNDPATQRLFGRALPLRVAQILDDLANTDTDTSAASQAANPMMFVTGGSPAGLTPGAALGLPDGGSAGFVDTSKNLDALLKFNDALLDRLSVNSRLAQAILGRVQPNDVPSGYALELGFHPARNLMSEMRTVRDEKYPLILKFAMRLAQAYGALPDGETPAASIELGASLPADKPAAIDAVKELLPIHAISTATAVRILTEAGLPIDDAEKEVAAIQQEAFEAAVKLVEATGDVEAARSRLGLPERTPVVTPPADPAPEVE